jgi:hypothetical protein
MTSHHVSADSFGAAGTLQVNGRIRGVMPAHRPGLVVHQPND